MNDYLKITKRRLPFKTKLHINLNSCHTNEWDNYNYKNSMFHLKQNKNITILKL